MSTERKFGSITSVADSKLCVSGSTGYLSFFGTSGASKQVVGTVGSTGVTADVITGFNTLVTALKSYGLV